LMGVGDPLDLVVCVALGVDMFDCVYPTRTARFGTALTSRGAVHVKHKASAQDFSPLEPLCACGCCRGGYTRAALHLMFRDAARSSLGGALLSLHNISYMLRLSAEMRAAVAAHRYGDWCREFLALRGELLPAPPLWVRDALASVGIDV
jgi:tRNA-guanine family transglycosylase